MTRTLLIDGDIVNYQICAANEQDLRFDSDFHVLYSDGLLCAEQSINYIEGLKSHLDADKIIVVLSDDTENFRKDFHPEYKANRKGTRKPLAFKAVREALRKEYKALTEAKLETDDILTLLSSDDRLKGEKIIVSIDKDFEQCSGYLYNPSKDRHSGPRFIKPEQADLFLYRQVLIGDRTDNYFGCPNVGEVKAKNLIKAGKSRREWWDAIVTAYKKEGFDEAYALNQARCARLLRAGEWDKQKREVKLWEPWR